MTQLIAAAMQGLTFPAAEKSGQTVIDHDAEVSLRMTGVRHAELLQDAAQRYKSLKNQPMATLAIAAALGFVLGAIWKT